MIFHENRLLADDSQKYHMLFFGKLRKMLKNLSYAAVMIGALRVKWPGGEINTHYHNSNLLDLAYCITSSG